VAAFWNFYLAVFPGLIGLLVSPIQSATCQTLLQSTKMSNQQAEKAGFKQQKFSFQMPSLDFETFVPKNAQVSTTPYRTEAIKPGQIGRVLPIGQMKFSKEGIEFESIIFSYRLQYPPAALRTCTWQMSHEGYGILHNYAPDELVEAQIFGIQLDEQKKPQTATIAYCYARGDILIAHYFMASLPTDEKQAENAVNILQETISGFVANMKFADGQPNELDPSQIKKKILTLDNGNLPLFFPKNLEIVIDNSDKNTLPYEMHIIQKLQSGKMFSHLFLWINTTDQPTTEEALKQQAEIFTNIYISSQIKSDTSPDGIQQEFIGSNSVPGYAQNDIIARSYHYKIIEKSKPDIPTIFHVTLIRDKDKLYAMYYHSLRTDNSSASEYFTGSAGDVAYDMIRNSIRNFLLKKQ